MKKILFLLTACAFGLNCGGGATNANKPANAAANTPANANKPASTPTPASSPAASNTSSEKTETGTNPDLDFTLVNSTGYDIKEVYIGPTSNKD